MRLKNDIQRIGAMNRTLPVNLLDFERVAASSLRDGDGQCGKNHPQATLKGATQRIEGVPPSNRGQDARDTILFSLGKTEFAHHTNGYAPDNEE